MYLQSCELTDMHCCTRSASHLEAAAHLGAVAHHSLWRLCDKFLCAVIVACGQAAPGERADCCIIIGMAMYSAERLSGTLNSAALFEHLMLCEQAVSKSADAYPCACGQRPTSGVAAAGKPAARGSEQAGPECRRSWMRPAEPGATSLAKIRTSSVLYCRERTCIDLRSIS